MSVEQFANVGQTTINQVNGIAAGDTSVTVASNTGFPANASFRIRIDSELILVTAGQGGVTWTISRGIENTTPAAHANGATVTQVVTNGGLLNAFMTKIDEVGPVGGATASLTFPNLISSIPQTFRSLCILGQSRSDNSGTTIDLVLQFNNDTGSNYDSEVTVVDGSTAPSDAIVAGGTGINSGIMPGSTTGTSRAGDYEIWLPGYSLTTWYKTMSSYAGNADGTSSGSHTRLLKGNWRNTAAITSIKLFPGAGNFVAGSWFSLYGIP